MGDDLFKKRENARDIFINIENKLKMGLFSETLPYFDTVIELDMEYPFLYESLSCVKYWINREEKIINAKGKDLALLLEDYYRNFLIFASERKIQNIDTVSDIKHYVFTTIINVLQEEYNKTGDARTLFTLSKALIEIGEYKKAAKALEYLRKNLDYTDGKTLSMLADVYYKLNNIRFTKLYLREAFFYDPYGIEESIIHNPIVEKIKDKIEKYGIHIEDDKTFKMWLGVYGEVFNILDVKSELSDTKALNLRASISKFEADFKKREMREETKPRLMLSYLWLMSFLLIKSKSNLGEIEMITKKMASIDSELTREYVSSVSIDSVE